MAVSTRLIDTLNDLLMLDHDAVEAYEQAIKRIEFMEAKTKLTEFQSDHKRHISELRRLIAQYGATPKDRKDVKGFFIKGMTAVQSMAGDEMALKAMQTNEKLTNRKYEEAMSMEMPDDVRMVVQRNRTDEARHLAWVEQALMNRIWEGRGMHV